MRTIQGSASKDGLQNSVSAPTENESSDAELLDNFVATGDRHVLELLVRRHAPMVAGVCRSTVADISAAEDAFQATFLIFFESARKIRHGPSLAAWLHGVAFRTACRARKQWRERLKQVADFNAQNLAIEECPDPLARIARQMELDVLNEELHALPESLRVPLVEHFGLGISAVEIAQRLALTPSAVEGRIRRGKRRLRSRMAKRGIGLSVAVISATWFQQPVVAESARLFTMNFLESHLAHWPKCLSKVSATKTEISSLVQRELSMSAATALKVLLPTAIVLGMGTFFVLSSEGQSGKASDVGQTSSRSWALQSVPEVVDQSVLFQIASAQVKPPTADKSKNSQAKPLSASGETPAGAPKEVLAPPRQPTKIESWDEDGGEKPEWLTQGSTSADEVEEYRKRLAETVNIDFNHLPLNVALSQLSDQNKFQLWINIAALETLGVDSESPITVTMKNISLRNALKLMLEPLDLTYVPRESYLEITSKDSADAQPLIAYYDLSHFLPNTANVQSIMQSIESHVEPDRWLSAGGQSSITVVGSLMIVSCPETTHERIRSMLGRISRVPKKNLSVPVPDLINGVFGGGMGGMGTSGMGGMF